MGTNNKIMQIKEHINRFDRRLREKKNIKAYTLNPEHYFYRAISNIRNFEKAKTLFKYIIVNKDKYNMNEEELNNMLKCYNVYNNADRSFDFLQEEEYIRKLEKITDIVKFDYEGKEYIFKMKID